MQHISFLSLFLYRHCSFRLPTIQGSRNHVESDDPEDADVPQTSRSDTTGREPTQRRPSLRSTSAKCLPEITLPRGPTRVGAERLRAQLRLPPLVDASRSLSFPSRSLVRQQLRIHRDCAADVSGDLMSIDRVPSPELKPKKMTSQAVEVSTK